MVTTCSATRGKITKKVTKVQSPTTKLKAELKEPNTDMTLPLPTPMKANMAKEIRQQLKGVPQPKFPETTSVLYGLESHIRQKIDQLKGKIIELENTLVEDLEWCRRVTSNKRRRHCYGKYELFASETKRKHKRKVALTRKEIEELIEAL
jgi:hypothetical protein